VIVQVDPVYEPSVRAVCVKAYPLHPHGCPNFAHKDTCPPKAPKLPEVFDLTRPCYAIINSFDLGNHVTAMQLKHPEWSARQLTCCLYWQPKARKMLEMLIAAFVAKHPGHVIARCPEAMGLNVTETLRRAGVEMEWPPVNIALQVALAARPAPAKEQK